MDFLKRLMSEEVFLNNPIGQKLGYQTQLSPKQEKAYKQWALQLASQAPQFADAVFQMPNSDYDYRAAFKAGQTQGAINQNDHQIHLNDTGKLPWHGSFSGESAWAQPGDNPTWLGLGANEQYLKPFKWRR